MLRKLTSVATLVFVASLTAVPQAAPAASTTDTITVNAHIANTCIFNTTTDTIDFGLYDPIVTNATTDITRTYTASYTCTAGDATYKFAFNSSTGSGTSCLLSDSGTVNLTYHVTDASSHDFCNGTAAANSAEATATGSNQNVAFTFTLTHGQNTANAGSYTDTNTVTISP